MNFGLQPNQASFVAKPKASFKRTREEFDIDAYVYDDHEYDYTKKRKKTRGEDWNYIQKEQELKYICQAPNVSEPILQKWRIQLGLPSYATRDDICQNLTRLYNLKGIKPQEKTPIRVLDKKYLDPITQKPLYHPVLTSTGVVFNLETIQEHAKKSNTCPVTGEFLKPYVYFLPEKQNQVYEYLHSLNLQPEIPKQKLEKHYLLLTPFMRERKLWCANWNEKQSFSTPIDNSQNLVLRMDVD